MLGEFGGPISGGGGLLLLEQSLRQMILYVSIHSFVLPLFILLKEFITIPLQCVFLFLILLLLFAIQYRVDYACICM